MASLVRHYPHIPFVSMSPVGTTGANGMDELLFLKKGVSQIYWRFTHAYFQSDGSRGDWL